MNFNETQLRNLGYVQDGNGNWSRPPRRRVNDHPGEAQSPVVERPVLNAPVVEVQGETCYTGRVLIRVFSFRRRLIDPDNGTIKWMVDSLRYLKIIGNDRPQDIEIGFSQTKVSREQDEGTVITITPL